MSESDTLDTHIDYILKVFHTSLRADLLKLSDIFRELNTPIYEEFKQDFFEFKKLLIEHMDKEEEILFPVMRRLEKVFQSGGKLFDFHCESIQTPLLEMEYEHQVIRNYSEKITDFMITLEMDSSLQRDIVSLMSDIQKHSFYEDEILYILAIKKEQKCL